VERNPAIPTPLPAPAEGIKARQQQYLFSAINYAFYTFRQRAAAYIPANKKNLPIEEVR